MMSVRTRSGRCRRAATSASSPLATASTSCRGRKQARDIGAHIGVVVGQAEPSRGRRRQPPPPAGRRRSASPRTRRRARPAASAAPPARRRCARPAGCVSTAPARPASLRQMRAAEGERNVNAVPFPTSLSTAILPPCSFTNSWTSASPMPLPSWLRPRAPSMR